MKQVGSEVLLWIKLAASCLQLRSATPFQAFGYSASSKRNRSFVCSYRLGMAATAHNALVQASLVVIGIPTTPLQTLHPVAIDVETL